MGIVEKIESIGSDKKVDKPIFNIHGNSAAITIGILDKNITGGFIIGSSKREAVWKACVKFAKYYNNEQEPNIKNA